jgi:hypothetical protein
VTTLDLPENADDARALFRGGREPGIFVRFRTDSKGIDYILSVFGRKAGNPQTVDLDLVRALISGGGHVFVVPSQWEKEVGIRLFDPEAIGSGRELEYMSPPGTRGYKVFMDDQNSTVYIRILHVAEGIWGFAGDSEVRHPYAHLRHHT